MEKIIEQIVAECQAFIADSEKGTKAAHRRMRKNTQNIAKLGKEFRKVSLAEDKKAE